MPDRRRRNFPGVAVGVFASIAFVLAAGCSGNDKPVDVRTAGVSDTASQNGPAGTHATPTSAPSASIPAAGTPAACRFELEKPRYGSATGTTSIDVAVLPAGSSKCHVSGSAKLTIKELDGSVAKIRGNPATALVDGNAATGAPKPWETPIGYPGPYQLTFGWEWFNQCAVTAQSYVIVIALGDQTVTDTLDGLPPCDRDIGPSRISARAARYRTS